MCNINLKDEENLLLTKMTRRENEIKNLFRKSALLFVIVLTIICISSGVFAAYNSYTCEKTDSVHYFEILGSNSDDVFYDYGTAWPFDDACVQAQSSGAGSNYVYASVYFGTSGHYYNSFTKTDGKTAVIKYVSTGYDYMTGNEKGKNSNLNGIQLTITN